MDTAQQEIAALERIVGPQGASPLFARLADLYLAAGRPKDALRVCDAGLAYFPFYSTGHFVKGRTLIALEMMNEARRELEFVRDWLPTNPTIWSYLDSLPVSDDQTLALAPETEAPTETVYEEPAFAPASITTEDQTTPGSFFSAITEATPPEAAADTVSTPASPAEENVFGLPSEAPAGGFGGFGGGGTAEEAPQSFGGFGGFGGLAESPAPAEQEPETASPSSAGFSGFGEAAGEATETTDTGFHTQEEPVVSYEETVTSALGEGAPGFVPSSGAEAQEVSFEAYTDRLRLDLGPTGLISLEQFLEGDGIVPNEVSRPGGFDFGDIAAPESLPEPEAPVQETPASFGGLDFSGLPTADEPAAPPPAPAAEEGGFSGPGFEGPPVPEAPSSSSDTSIEGLTEKLQGAKKITPVIDFSSKTSSDSNENTMVSSGFVTPTLAEIYAKQGWYDDAIKAYRTLSKTKPADREKYEARIAELEEQKKKQE